MKNFSSFVLLVCGIALSSVASAQNFAGHTWHFGTGTQGLRFSRSGNAASLTTHSSLAGVGGSGVVSSSVNGDLLFYTDGVNVFDASHAVMPSGTGVGGTPVQNQPVAVAKVPGSQTQYYIITRSGIGDVSYTTVDMGIIGNAPAGSPALGDVSAPATLIGGLTVRSEGMITVPHSNGTDFWLITHTQGSPDYAVTPFTTGGPGTTVAYPGIGSINNAANFAFHAATNRIAVSPSELGRNAEIINFDRTTGAITFNKPVTGSGSATGIYDTEWSNSGQYLYVSGGTDVRQFDVSNGVMSPLSVVPQPASFLGSYGIQMAPDSAIYHLYEVTAGVFRLGKITNADTIATALTYTAQAFAGNIDFDARQFPAFTPAANPNFNLSFTVDGTCANAPSSFFPTVTPTADSLVWDFGDGNGSSDWSPVHTYTAGQAYTVSLTAYLNGVSQSVTQPVNITQFDTQITLVQDTTACSCELPFPKDKTVPRCGTFSVTAQIGGSGSATWQWYGPAGPMNSGSGASATLSPDSSGYYYLVATVGACSTSAGVYIKEYGQQDQRANIWFFGDRAGLDFNPLPDNPVKPIANGVMNAPEGTATISDRNGQVIFFTDGNTVWNRQEAIVAENISGNAGGADAPTQAALIIPVPGDETLYYIFTTPPVYGSVLNQYEMRYTLFDLKLNNGTGGIVDPDNNPATPPSTVLFTKSTERVTGNENWVIAHEYGNNSFRAYRVTQQGLSNPVISSIGSDHSYANAEQGRGYMKLNTQGKLAVALSTPGMSNVIELFDFADSSGSVTNYRRIDLAEPSGQVYGIEFSSGGSKLYASTIGNSKLFELAYDSATNTYTKRAQIPVVTPPGEIGAIQTGPDGNIYVATNNSNTLGTIQAVEDVTRPSTFNPAGQPLAAGTTSKLGLPNFIQTLADPQQGPGMVVNGTCLGDSTNFSASGTDPIDKFQWYFGDGQGSTEQTVSHLYAAAGSYTVTLIITNRCGLNQTLTQTVVINAPPAPPTFLPAGQFPVICHGPLTLEATEASNPNLANLTFLWNNNATTRTIVADRQNNYSVTITDNNGCTSDGSIVVGDNRPIVELGPDQTVCQNATVAALDAQNPGFTYAWELNGAPLANTSRTQPVTTATPTAPVDEYKVEVTDPITTCSRRDSIRITVNAVPVFTLAEVDATGCAVPNGSITTTISDPVGSTFSWALTGPVPSSGSNQAVGSFTVNSLTSGAYGMTVTEQISGCSSAQTIPLSGGVFTVTGVQNGTCDPINIQVTVVGGATAPIDYKVYDVSAPATPVEQGSPTTSPFFTNAPGLPSNSKRYIVEVTTGGCTEASDPIAVNHDPKPPVTFSADLCANPTELTLTGGTGTTTYAWTGPNIVGSSTQAQIQVNPTAGSYTYNVTVNDVGFCRLDSAFTVVIGTPVTANFTQSAECADVVTLTATPNGSYLYRWYHQAGTSTFDPSDPSTNPPAVDPNLAGPQVTVPRANDGQYYAVSLYDGVTGCNYSMPSKVVEVNGVLSVLLTNTFACEGSPFTLTATPTGNVASYTWSFNGTPVAGQNGATYVVQEGKSGRYSVVATDGFGCTDETSIQVLTATTTEGNLTSLARICPDPANPDPKTREATLTPGTFQSYEWFKDGVSLGITAPTITVDEAGTYSVNLVNNLGCPSSDQAEVVVNCEPLIVGPNAFRPSSSVTVGGDPVNQTFRLFTFFIDDEGFDIYIFNRWGEMVYHSTERDFQWNGGYNNNAGQLAPTGTYTYVVRYKSSYEPTRGVQEKRGGVVLLR